MIQAGSNRRGHGVLEVRDSRRRVILDVYARAEGNGIVMVCDPARGSCRDLAAVGR